MIYDKNEYPRPQFMRNEWINLNGKWTCHISRKVKFARDFLQDTDKITSHGFENEIIVPFAPETSASGLHITEIIDTIWYQRTITIPESWKNRCILLHFGAVFYHAEIYLDGEMVGFHDGGSSSFTIDLTSCAIPGSTHSLIVKATANLQDGSIPSGKQSSYVSSYGCMYQRTTGIWQTVWMEGIHMHALKSARTVWNASTSSICFIPTFQSLGSELTLRVKVNQTQTDISAKQGIPFFIHIDNPILWEPTNPYLYEIEYEVYHDGKCIDHVSSYIGLRSLSIIGNDTYLNGKKLYYRFVLDQGYYPEGNWTAPSDASLAKDIKLGLASGFNGARLHQKVFEERYLYYADKLGYLVWEETPSWGLDYNDEGLPARNFLHELEEIIERDVNHPCIIGWTPLNETWCFANKKAHRRIHKEAYETAKRIDPTRPVNDASGYIHYCTDLWTVHTYEQDPKKLEEQLKPVNGKVFRNYPQYEANYQGQPYVVDEYGGVKWDPETQKIKALAESQNLQSWGYGEAPISSNEYLERMKALTQVILSIPHISGFCYTQLTDVEQERNGLYTYSRIPKFSTNEYYKIFSQKPKEYDL